MLKYIFILFVFLQSIHCNSQYKSNGSLLDSIQINRLTKEADSLSKIREFNTANKLYYQLAEYYQKSSSDDFFLETVNKISLNYLIYGEHTLALSIIQDNLNKVTKIDSLILSDSYYYISISLFYGGIFEEGLLFAKKALQIKLNSPQVDSLKLSKNFNMIGIINKHLGYYDQALHYYQKYLNICLILQGVKGKDVANAYNNIGILYFEHFNDRERALEYYYKSTAIKEATLDSLHTDLGESYNNLGNILMKKKPQKALGYYRKALKIYNNNYIDEHYNKIQTYNSIGECFYLLDKFDSAHLYFDKVVRASYASLGEEHQELALAYLQKSITYQKTTNTVLAKKYGTMAISLYEKKYSSGAEISLAYLQLARFFFQEEEMQKAYDYCVKSIKSCFVSDSLLNLDKIHVENINALDILIEALNLKASILNKKNLIVSDSQTPQGLYDITVKIYREMMLRYQSEYSNEAIRDGLYSTLEKTLSLGGLRNKETYLKVQEGKSIFFKTCVNIPNDVQNNKYLTDSIFMQEKSIKNQMEMIENRLVGLMSDNTANNSSDISISQDELFLLRRNLDKVISYLREYNPKYYQLKYDAKIASIKEIQNQLLKENETLIEYFLGDSSIYIFAMTKLSYIVNRVKRDSSFNQQLKTFRKTLNQPNLINHSKVNYQEYISSAHSLYNYLIAPVDSLIKGKDLIIVPDGELALIPFEALLTNKASSAEIDYQSLPYLIKKHAISYANSATLLFNEMQNSKTLKTSNNGDILAFAPNFENDLLAYNTEDTVRSKLSPLNWTVEEVNNLATYFATKVYTNAKATEKNFKQEAGNYSILHIASHGLVDDEHPMYSKIAFAMDKADTINDGYLHTFELYNTELNADMAVLSACNTGYGKVLKGEGVLNLARGFFYAGCKTVVMSLWVANDKSTATLMGDFYKYLADGQPKNTALQNAKLDYVKNNEGLKAHPYYWSQFVISGNTDSISGNLQSKWIVYLFIGGAALLFLTIYFVNKNKLFKTLLYLLSRLFKPKPKNNVIP